MNRLSRMLACGASMIALSALALTAAPALAQDDPAPAASGPAADDPQDQSRDVVVIFGRAEEQIGKAQSASEGVVGYADLSTRPISRAAELVEVIPGMIATEHSSGARPTSTSCAASTSITAPISAASSTACRSTSAPTRI